MCELPTLYNATGVKARKEHRCGECKGTIAVGEEYERVTGKWDGKMRTYATCDKCRELRAKVTANFRTSLDWEEGPAFGELYEWIRECGGEA